MGPRALGHRSILADPRQGGATREVNTKIKFRETFRPFAPSLLVEVAGRYFESPWRASDRKVHAENRSLRDEMRGQIPALHMWTAARGHIWFNANQSALL